MPQTYLSFANAVNTGQIKPLKLNLAALISKEDYLPREQTTSVQQSDTEYGECYCRTER